MKTSDAIRLVGSRQALADALGITRQAISQWGETVPRLREFELRDLLAAQRVAQAPRARAEN